MRSALVAVPTALVLVLALALAAAGAAPPGDAQAADGPSMADRLRAQLVKERRASDHAGDRLRAQLVKERRAWDRTRVRLGESNRQLRRENRRLRRGRDIVTAANPHLRSIALCESGGDPDAVSGGGRYRGKYQFDQRTWRSVGGRGDPADAPEVEQDFRAYTLYQRRGAQPWPVCG